MKEMKDLKKDNEPREGTSNRDSDHNSDSAKPQNRRRTGVPAVPGGEAYRFKPGQSGNPGGRPKTGALTLAFRALLEKPVPRDARKRTYAQAIADAVVELARRGHLGAVRELANRAEGRAAPAVSVDESLNEFAVEDEVSDSSKADTAGDGNPRVD